VWLVCFVRVLWLVCLCGCGSVFTVVGLNSDVTFGLIVFRLRGSAARDL